MYLSHFGLKRKPFEIAVDPDFIWLGEKHAEALATFKYGILENIGFLLLTGDVGTGKTSLVNCFLKSIRNQLHVATVPDPGLEILDFFNFISAEFGLNGTFNSKGAFLIHFKKFLHHAYRQKMKVLLTIDECQRLEPGLLEQIRLLSNIEMPQSKLINIFFVGQTEFNTLLEQEQNRALSQRISIRYNLELLNEPEIRQYVAHRLDIAGSKQQIFTEQSFRDIYVFSSGYPRLINILCDRALLTGYARNAKQIDSEIIKECAAELQTPFKSYERKNVVGNVIDNADTQKPVGRIKKILANRASRYIVYVIVFLIISSLCGVSLSALGISPLEPVKTWVELFVQFILY